MFEILPIINFFLLIGSFMLIAILKVEAINFRNELRIQREKLTEARRDIFTLEGSEASLRKQLNVLLRKMSDRAPT